MKSEEHNTIGDFIAYTMKLLERSSCFVGCTVCKLVKIYYVISNGFSRFNYILCPVTAAQWRELICI
jgi:hypothetical protein